MRRLLALSCLLVLSLLRLHGPAAADEPTAKEKPAGVLLDSAKIQRLTRLLDSLPVLNELNVNDEVYARLQDLKDQEHAEDQGQMEALNRQMKAARELPPQERAEKTRGLMQLYMNSRNAVSESYAFKQFDLLTGPQMERLSQIDLQDQGIAAFHAEDVAGVLKLSSDVQKQIDAIAADYEPKFLALLKARIVREAENAVVRSRDEKVRELLKERTAKVEQVLTKDQREKLATLRGQPFDVSLLGRALGEMPDFPRSSRLSPFVQELLKNEAVIKDLQLGPEDQAAIKAAGDKHMQNLREVYGGVNGADGEKLTAVQRALRDRNQMEARMQRSQKIEQEYALEINKHLSESQLKRLRQINWQRDPRRAVFDPETREALGLTTEQMQKMLEVQRETMKSAQVRPEEIKTDPKGYLERRLAERQKQRDLEEARTLEVLTPEQRQKLKDLQGPPFDVSLLEPEFRAPKAESPKLPERSSPNMP